MFDLSLVDPGRATNFFGLFSGLTFHSTKRDFDLTNALWLAEISRLIYRRSGEVNSHPAPLRRDFLRVQELEELHFFSDDKTQAALVGGRGFRVLVFRGTEPLRLLEDLRIDADVRLEPWQHGGHIHKGFRDAFLDIWEKKIEPHRGDLSAPLFLTGHSLGAALATIATSFLIAEGIPVAATYNFGSPRVGDAAFTATLAHQPIYRIVNDNDVITTVPPCSNPGYCHVGTLVHIAHNGALEVSEHARDENRVSIDILDHVPSNYVERLRARIS
ncbi:MAG TPA: lipase family protein [Thermoanaerobaculia bacterium]|nr:lipase family protein [Thermoanaerobaculia bacterium]